MIKEIKRTLIIGTSSPEDSNFKQKYQDVLADDTFKDVDGFVFHFGKKPNTLFGYNFTKQMVYFDNNSMFSTPKDKVEGYSSVCFCTSWDLNSLIKSIDDLFDGTDVTELSPVNYINKLAIIASSTRRYDFDNTKEIMQHLIERSARDGVILDNQTVAILADIVYNNAFGVNNSNVYRFFEWRGDQVIMWEYNEESFGSEARNFVRYKPMHYSKLYRFDSKLYKLRNKIYSIV